MLSLNLTGVVQVICYTLYSGSNKQRQIEMERVINDKRKHIYKLVNTIPKPGFNALDAAHKVD